MIRNVTKLDIDKIIEIENLTFTDGRYSKEQMLYELSNELSKFVLCERDNKIVGFLIYMITFNSSTIVQIATDPHYQRQGVATELFTAMLDDINSLGYGQVETITLEVRKQNDIAHNFYLKNNFKDVIIKPKYYSNGDDAIYMSRILL